MELSCPSTFLSPKVYHILCESGVTVRSAQQALTNAKTLNWDYLQSIMPDEPDSEEYFIKCAEALAPIFHMIDGELSTWTSEDYKKYYSDHMKWIRHVNMMEVDFIWAHLDGSDVIHSLLFSTSVLERALGNVYLTEGSQCPSMLKDLLLTSQLRDILGLTVIRFLRVLIGPPISLNLRNVVWHGFPKPGEIPVQYLYVLYCVMASIGEILKEKGIQMEAISVRPSITFPQIAHLDNGFHDLAQKQEGSFDKVFQASSFCPSSMVPIYEKAMHFRKQKRYGDMSALLLPQLEHGLRRVFAAVNNCPERVLTAESTVLFTTFEEMLHPILPDGTENKLRFHIGDGIMNMLFDLLAYPEGPRVRDRISHGETVLADFPPELANQILMICTALSMQFLSPGHFLCKEIFFTDVTEKMNNYQSRFHPISLLRAKVNECCLKLSCWVNLRRPDHTFTDVTWSADGELEPIHMEEFRAAENLLKCRNLPASVARMTQAFVPLDELQLLLFSVNISTSYRGQLAAAQCQERESELVGLLRRISTKVADISDQISQVTTARYQQWENKELRSRQRNTYKRMLDSIPVVSCGLRLILICISCELITLDTFLKLTSQEQAQKIKLLKVILQHAENVFVYTSLDRNRWDEACVSTHSVTSNIDQHYVTQGGIAV